VPVADVKNPAHLNLLEDWLRSYRPKIVRRQRSLFEIVSSPAGTRRMGANPHANGGLLKNLRLPDFRLWEQVRQTRSDRNRQHAPQGVCAM
jgi:xylulose-5-phosphate/fructose-6-phosphate phosphoketolase